MVPYYILYCVGNDRKLKLDIELQRNYEERIIYAILINLNFIVQILKIH